MDRDEVLRAVQVDPEKIVCRTCRFKNSGSEYPHFTKSYCGIYRKGGPGKPVEVLFEGANCEYYIHE